MKEVEPKFFPDAVESRLVAMSKEELIEEIRLMGSILEDANLHLNYIGYGDAWEREVSEDLQKQLAWAEKRWGIDGE